MKRKTYIALAALPCIFAMGGCGLDNYEEPSSTLTGKIVYQGEPLGLRHGKVVFDLYQEGYEKNEPIKVHVAGDGSFSALLFDGDYRMTATDNNGPWLNSSGEMKFTLTGSKYLEYEVDPYYLLSDVAIVFDGAQVRAVCSVAKIAGDKNAQRLFLCVSPRKFIDDQSYSYIARKNQMPVNIGVNSINLDISDIAESNDVLYARLGLQIAGVAECIYSDVIQIK